MLAVKFEIRNPGRQQRGHHLNGQRVLDQSGENLIEIDEVEDAHIVLVGIDADVARRLVAPLALLGGAPQPCPQIVAGVAVEHAGNDRETFALQLRFRGIRIDWRHGHGRNGMFS